MGVIYKITSPTGRIYIGQTKCKRTRFAAYRHSIKTKNYNTVLFNSFKKYGWGSHIIEVLETIDDNLLTEREIYWISQLKSYWQDNPLGMNMTRGGEAGCGSWMHKTELRKWFSHKFSGAGNPFYGKSHTAEAKESISEKAQKRNIERGITIPKWGAEKGRLKVIKAVVCYGLNGNFIKEYESISSAVKDTKTNTTSIVRCCNMKQTNAGGYVFRYKTQNYPLNILVKEIKFKTVKKPVVCISRTRIVEYQSAEDASIDLRIPKQTIIYRATRLGKVNMRNGRLKFMYLEDYNKVQKVVT